MKKRYSFAVALIILAILIALSAFNVINGIGVWTLIFSFVIAWIFIVSLLRIEFVGIFVSIALGILLYQEQLGLLNINLWPIVLAALLLGIGLNIIFKRKDRHHYFREEFNKEFQQEYRYSSNKMHNSCRSNGFGKETFDVEHVTKEDIIDDEIVEDDVITYRTRFSDNTKFVKATSLNKIYLDNEFGSLNIYLDQATLSNEGATVEVYSRFGTVKIFVKSDAYLESQLTYDLGSISIPSNNCISDQGHNKFVFKGNALCGEIKVLRI
ncbi:hypothetical protein LJB88_01500 [Erysipelotrichaceae bacterium OttesenSCG-928-M19]|nr:hypothetical protein [Erysipelotrichaceae bacterium OttesenSCG-928-M19]